MNFDYQRTFPPVFPNFTSEVELWKNKSPLRKRGIGGFVLRAVSEVVTIG